MSETAGHLAVLKTDVAWNVHHMEKLIVPIPTTVIGDLTAKFLLNLTEEKKTSWKVVGVNRARAASCFQLFSCSLSTSKQDFHTVSFCVSLKVTA